ncbi:hypothetical protein [Levilactobacillus brevis]|uniref:hypothetical protein n=1 Tax=Levilactobacillus brevis TaxID=1580 RepID=UPI001BA5011E|nr:hypothetical protein [Levilactobacillus brevis]MBS1013855.1 hypothetical protein [Levilactobacillus brevis]
MKIKSRILLGTLVAMAVVSFGTSTVNASSWHKGLPNSLKYTKWHHGSTKINFGKKAFSLWGPEGGLKFGIPETNVHYKYLGHHRYVIKHDEPHSGITNVASYVSHLSKTKFFWKWDKSSPWVANYRY